MNGYLSNGVALLNRALEIEELIADGIINNAPNIDLGYYTNKLFNCQ
jgi:hypothetical protein